jgi:hypothetical protein
LGAKAEVVGANGAIPAPVGARGAYRTGASGARRHVYVVPRRRRGAQIGTKGHTVGERDGERAQDGRRTARVCVIALAGYCRAGWTCIRSRSSKNS